MRWNKHPKGGCLKISRGKIVIVLQFFLTLFLLQLAYAQFGTSIVLKFHGEFKPLEGSWSEYHLISECS